MDNGKSTDWGNLSPSLAQALQKPGKYRVPNQWMRARGAYMMLEVDENLVAYQLDPQDNRDGVLPVDGWSPMAEVYDERGQVVEVAGR